MAETTADQIADGFIAFCNQHGDLLTNLKLQKLVYYAQAWWLAIHDAPLFDDRLEAWVHGTVQPALYQRFKPLGWQPILLDTKADHLQLGVSKHLAEVIRAYGSYSAFDLEQLTHSEYPWIQARGALSADAVCHNAISHEDMKLFYRGKLGGKA